ncbi:hypothetical protein F2Q69_00050482 [Brassica cretica]|uniref:Uncharacterized protein n=1 Tax=Brassica cretica TaxID=69181 RepID=A0A8S9PYY7_BRACR|nr:hypothetical protein F2Q69_00050482 [Brassica cretica]
MPSALPNLRSQKGHYSSKICYVDSDFFSSTRSFLVETEKKLWVVVRDGELSCGGLNWWSKVVGLEAIISSNYLISVTNSGQDQRVLVWWKTNYAEECETEIWCAQILIEIWGHKMVRGCIEWFYHGGKFTRTASQELFTVNVLCLCHILHTTGSNP